MKCPRFINEMCLRAPAPMPLACSARAQRPLACVPARAARQRPAPARSAPYTPSTCLKLNWAVAIQVLYQFFFFFFSQPLENTKKIYIYLFSFIFQYTNKFIKICFIYIIIIIFSPTNQINCLNLFYLFSCSSLHIVNSKVCFPTCLCAIYLSTQTFTSHGQHVIHTKHIHTTIHQST